MTPDEFQQTLAAGQPPLSCSPYLKAMWYDGKGDWEAAHLLVQDMDDAIANRIHAYLHRKEGDTSNAGYWYRRAGLQLPALSMAEEWKMIVAALL